MVDSVGVANATITVTRAPDRLFQSTTTDASGRWSLIFAEGTGDYLVHATAVGYGSARKRAQRDPRGAMAPIIFSVKPLISAQQIATVKVSAERPRPERREFESDTPGNFDQVAVGFIGALPPTIAGDLGAITSLTPGVMTTPGGLSVLGVSAAGSMTTLGGLGYSGASIPRDAKTTVRISTTSFDPSVGWFSAFSTNVNLEQGSVFAFRRAGVTVDAPMLQSSAAGDARFSNTRLSTGGDGMFWGEHTAYSYGVDAGHRSSPFLSIENATPARLIAAGLSPDSAARFRQLSTPMLAGASSGNPNATNSSLSLIGRIDRAPYDIKTYEPTETVLAGIGFLNVSDNTGAGGSPLAASASASRLRNAGGGFQGIYSSFIRKTVILDVRSVLSLNRTEANSLYDIPAATVGVNGDATGSRSIIQFGGSGDRNISKQLSWETAGDALFFYDKAAKHSGVIAGDIRFDGFDTQSNANSLGAFSYNSLDDLEKNIPSAFTRFFNQPSRTGGEWNGFVSISDQWRVRRGVGVMLGLRAEGNRFTYAPTPNPAIRQLFGVENNAVPNTFHISPRIGFTWTRRGYSATQFTNLGSFGIAPASFVRGGIGEFRSFIRPELVSSAAAFTGLPSATRQLSCIGSATPTPNWAGFVDGSSAIPSECVGGATASALRDDAPGVQLTSKNYQPPTSWRANLGYGSMFGDFPYSIDAVVSYNRNQPSRTNLNFANTARFAISDEHRPVFVNTGDIVARTGQVSSSGSRVSSQFGSVTQTSSDLRSIGKQVTFNVRTPRGHDYTILFAYTLAKVRAEETGFTGTTFDNPLQKVWARASADVRHQVVVHAGYGFSQSFLRNSSITASGVLQSGVPFTPIVASDVNGDGFRNDRAFILPSAGGFDCVRDQVGRPARSNSCEGPWSFRLNAQFTKNVSFSRFGRWAQIGIAFANPLGGLDQLLHGREQLRGWGAIPYADPVLYSVKGFDPASQKFSYVLNPGFGSGRYGSNTAPFRITLDARFHLGQPVPQQQLQKWLMPGRGKPGTKLGVEDLKKRYARNVNDPYRQIIQESDSLLLSREQSDSLAVVHARYLQRMDSLWTSLAEKLAVLPNNFDSKAALIVQEKAVDEAWELTRTDIKSTLGKILSPIQLAMLPGAALWLYNSDPAKPIQARTYLP